MSIRIALTHRTSYSYDRLINLGPQVIRLRPAPHTRTPIVSYSQLIQPAKHFLNWQQDPFGNYQARAVFDQPTDSFEVTIDLVADMVAVNPFDFFVDEEVFHVPFIYDANTKQDLAPYLSTSASGEAFDALAVKAAKLWNSGADRDLRTIDFLVELNQQVQSSVEYLVRMEPGVQSPEETLKKASGSCRDSAWLLANLLRKVGIASRFVSGYLIQLAPDERIEGQANGPEADFTDLHAWTEAFVPGAGWIGLDPTSGLFAAEGHIPLAATPSPGSAAPISGSLDPCEVSFDFNMEVQRIREPSRNTKPLTEVQWNALYQAGEKVDAQLEQNDVRLTQGGEPTFVSSSDRDGEEWTTDAVGPTKRIYADKLARKLLNSVAHGGVLTHGQGKWYPGESLPRWAFSIVWRNDGEALWLNPKLIAQEGMETDININTANELCESLCQQLDVDTSSIQPLYEDPAQHLLNEAQLPDNIMPGDPRLDDTEERARMVRIFDRGLGQPVAWVLPLQQAQASAKTGRTTRWLSEIWQTRRGALCLIPGDSPAGLRLPMDSLPWVPGDAIATMETIDPFDTREPLASAQILRQTRKDSQKTDTQNNPNQGADTSTSPQQSAGPAVRTALVVEPRDGQLVVFLPPTQTAEGYSELIASVETVAKSLGTPIRIEGYPPPRDPRFSEIKVTPDPGVIEVNVNPSQDWPSLVTNTQHLYSLARECGLDASGFMLDGRPTGSGGGAHVTLGGATPADSPFLRRPDLLGSIIRFWQNHPSLSYFFSGMFIGPTSQAPRIDEARSDSLYELELALAQLPGPDQSNFPPWLVDRLLRHLLIDVTGNTHRAEICIDKLYSPDGPAGRLGLLEFRAFEMPPHWQMNMAQQLLLRALIAWFWQTPYTASFVEHQTALQDKFMLPDVLWADFTDILNQVRKGIGVNLDASWYQAQFDFRFPLAGRLECDGTVLELRNALEPWHVLGEENTAGGTARYVDSSLERLQAKLITNLGSKPLGLVCNGIVAPLQTGMKEEEKICGIRFRSWLPASCLQPMIEPHDPLTFDLFDFENSRPVASCTYHATHPGGRNFEKRPINALEAEGRRLARFEPFGRTQGPSIPRSLKPDPRFPFTLDMRRAGI